MLAWSSSIIVSPHLPPPCSPKPAVVQLPQLIGREATQACLCCSVQVSMRPLHVQNMVMRSAMSVSEVNASSGKRISPDLSATNYEYNRFENLSMLTPAPAASAGSILSCLPAPACYVKDASAASTPGLAYDDRSGYDLWFGVWQ